MKNFLVVVFFSPTKADFIRAKHQMLAFVFRPGKDDTPLQETDLSQQLHSSVRTANLETSLRLLSQGADPNYFHEVSSNFPPPPPNPNSNSNKNNLTEILGPIPFCNIK